jgi:prevent-host-death family protein
MKTVTVREAQHNFAEILRAVENGETIEIVRRKTRVAHLTPISRPLEGVAGWGNHAERMAEIWGETMVRNVDETLDDLRGGR